MVLLDLNQIQEVDSKNQVLWYIGGLNLPLDVQYLPNGNVLVAEYHGHRVTERDRVRGEIRWQKNVANPLVAQRLPNHHTFVATDTGFFEFDEKGEEVLAIQVSAGEHRIMKAAKTPNGEIVALTTEARVVRFDAKGKELSSSTST